MLYEVITGCGNYRRGTPLCLDLLCGRTTLLEARAAVPEAPVPRLALTLCVTGICRSATVDEEEGGSVGEDSWERREAAHGGIVRDQFEV